MKKVGVIGLAVLLFGLYLRSRARRLGEIGGPQHAEQVTTEEKIRRGGIGLGGFLMSLYLKFRVKKYLVTGPDNVPPTTVVFIFVSIHVDYSDPLFGWKAPKRNIRYWCK